MSIALHFIEHGRREALAALYSDSPPRRHAPTEGQFTIYLCHACGWIQGEEEKDLSCARCGEPRNMIEELEVTTQPREPA